MFEVMAMEIKLDQLPVVIGSKDIKKWAQRLGFNQRHSLDFGSRQSNIFAQLSSSSLGPYWRHIMAHTLLPEEAEHIKKNILLRHLRRLEKDGCVRESSGVLPAMEHNIYLEYSSCIAKIKLLEAQTKSYEETVRGLVSEIRLVDNDCFNHAKECRELSLKCCVLAMSLRKHAEVEEWCNLKTSTINAMLKTKLLPLCPFDVEHSKHHLFPMPNGILDVMQQCYQLMAAAEAEPPEDPVKGSFMFLTHHSGVSPQELIDSITQCVSHAKRVVKFETETMEKKEHNEIRGSKDCLLGTSTSDGLQDLRSEIWELELKLIKERCSKADILSKNLEEFKMTIIECYPMAKVKGASMTKVNTEATINQLSDPRTLVKQPIRIPSYNHAFNKYSSSKKASDIQIGEIDCDAEDSAFQRPDECNDFCKFVHDLLSAEEFTDGISYKFTDSKDLKCPHSNSQVKCNESPISLVSVLTDANDNRFISEATITNEQTKLVHFPEDLATELNNWITQLVKHETKLCLTEKIKTMMEENKNIAKSILENYSTQYPVPRINEEVQEINELIEHLHSKCSLIASGTYERLFEEEKRSAEEAIQFLLAHPLKDCLSGLKDFVFEKEYKTFADLPLSKIDIIGFYSCSSRISDSNAVANSTDMHCFKILPNTSTPSPILQHTSKSILLDIEPSSRLAIEPTGFEPPKKQHGGPIINDDVNMESKVKNMKKKLCDDMEELEASIVSVKRELLNYQELRTFWAEQPLRHAIPADLTVEGYTYAEWLSRWQSAVEKLSNGEE